MAKDDWILSSEHPEEKIINMIKAKSNLNLNMHEPVNNIPDSTVRYTINRNRRNFGDNNFSNSIKRSSLVNRSDSFNKPSLRPQNDGLSAATLRRETLEMNHHKRMFVQGPELPLKFSRDRSNNSSPSSVDFDNRYSSNKLVQEKRRITKSKNHGIVDDSVSEISDVLRKNSLDEEASSFRSSRNSKYQPVKYPDDITRPMERNRKVKRSNSHYVPSTSKPDFPQERRRSDDLMLSNMSLYRPEVKAKEKKWSPIEKVKQFFSPNSKRKKAGDMENEQASVMSSRYKGNPGISQRNTKLKRTSSYSDSENIYRRPLSNSSRHLNGTGGYVSFGESEEENLRRRDKYLGKDEVDDSSATEGEIRHWKNDVYLHSSAVGDIPVNQSTLQRNGMRKTKSREELTSSKASLSHPVKKTLSRSLSVLSPWTPRPKKYKNDISYNYDAGYTSKPPRSPSKKMNGPLDSSDGSKKMNGDITGKRSKFSSGTLPNPRKDRYESSPDSNNSSRGKFKFVGKPLGGQHSSKTFLRKSHDSLNSDDYVSVPRRKTFNSESSVESSLPEEDISLRGRKRNHKEFTIPIKHQSGILRSTTIPRSNKIPSRTRN